MAVSIYLFLHALVCVCVCIDASHHHLITHSLPHLPPPSPPLRTGFENFFPKGGPKQAPKSSKGSADKKASNGKDAKQKESGKSAKEEATTEGAKQGKNSNSNKKKKTKKKKRASEGTNPFAAFGASGSSSSTPPDMESSTAGLLALLVAVVLVRQVLDAESQPGQEITWKDFRLHLMNDTEKIVVVNKSVARIYLADGAKGLPATGFRGGVANGMANGPVQMAGGWNDGTQMEWQGQDDSIQLNTTTTNNNNNTTNTNARGNKTKHHFYIGSVEGLEEKLTIAQQEHGIAARDYIPIQYINETNYTLEFLKLSPYIMLLAGLAYSFRTGAGAMGGRGGGGIFQIGKSNAKKISQEDVSVTFADVAGCQEAKKEIMEFVDFLQDSTRFTKLGAKIPKGALLCGPPGTGKTLLAKAVAGEAGVPFYSISGSDFIEMFVGVGPSRVRDLFKEARTNAPCIVFIDEIDAVGRQRGRGGVGGNDERENTLNQLLVEMDGFNPSTGVVVLAGTNRVDILDQALTRPGRFDRQITVDKPDLQGRKEIFQVHLKGITLEDDVEDIAGRLAGLTPGFAGADIANICNEAAIVAARRKAETVSMDDFQNATDRIVGGLESTKIMSKEERSVVAHHEAGHAVAGWFLEHADPLLKVTIIPRTSGALGYAQYLPKEVFLRTQDQIMDIVCMALAGRAAEEIFFGRVTTGASDDLRRVTDLVYSTIQVYGMNTRLGQLAFPKDPNAMYEDRPYSDATAKAMDEEAKSIVDAAYQRTLDLLTERKTEVEAIANMLLDKETITHDDVLEVIGPRPFKGDALYEEYIKAKQKGPEEAEAMNDDDANGEGEEEDGNDDDDEGKKDEKGDGTLNPGLA